MRERGEYVKMKVIVTLKLTGILEITENGPDLIAPLASIGDGRFSSRWMLFDLGAIEREK